jgi:hypothetical protein
VVVDSTLCRRGLSRTTCSARASVHVPTSPDFSSALPVHRRRRHRPPQQSTLQPTHLVRRLQKPSLFPKLRLTAMMLRLHAQYMVLF